jgi:flagellar hook-length control protein FliK
VNILQDIIELNIQDDVNLNKLFANKNKDSSNSIFSKCLKTASKNLNDKSTQDVSEDKNSEIEILKSVTDESDNTDNDVSITSLNNLINSLLNKENVSEENSSDVQKVQGKESELSDIVLASEEYGTFYSQTFNNLLSQLKSSDVTISDSVISNNFLNDMNSSSFSNVENILLANSISSQDQNLNSLQFDNLLDEEGEKLLNNLIDKILSMVNGKSTESSSNLELEKLGKILLSYNTSSQNNLEISTDNVKIQKFIEDNLAMIKSALEEKGVKIDDLNISEIKLNTNISLNEESNSGLSTTVTLENNQSIMNDTQQTKDFLNLFEEESNDKKGLELLKNSFQQGLENVLNNRNNTLSNESSQVASSVDSQKIVDNIVKNITQTIENGKTEIEVKMIPENLGKMTIKIAIEDGNLRANIEVKYPEIKHIIDTNLIKLRDNLQQNGIHLEQINVSVSDYNQSESNQSKYFQHNDQRSFVPEDLTVDEDLNSVRYMGYNTIEFLA